MKITFSTKDLQELCSKANPKILKKFKLDKIGLNKLQKRLMEIKAANSLADLYKMKPLHCHQLKADMEGEFGVYIDYGLGLRMKFIIADEPIPRLADGGIDRGKVQEIEIIYIGPHY